MTTEEVAAAPEEVIISGVTVSELNENMKSVKFTESCTATLSELMTKLLELADEAVAKNELKPEIEQIILTRKSAGSPFFSIELVMASSVTAEQVTTIQDRVAAIVNTRRAPKKRTVKYRAIDITSEETEHESVEQ